ncbi:MAG TPA: phosphoribosylamine--glycine ligase, partial [Kiloniellaceae bacterium]|nr:phosphoribosylamine--glycine ligase [Kiloniellaceae bacterium]
KGVTVAETLPEALAAVDAAMAEGVFGSAGAELVIEAVLVGEEASFLALVDGEHILPLASSQDHKQALDGDRGPNTGGMGAYSPAPLVTPEVERRIMTEVMEPLVAGMKAEGRPFKGLLYAGLMIAPDGSPQVVEFNVRFGDPECEAVLMRLKSDLLPALIATCDGQLKSFDLRWYDEAAMTVVLATKGYPGSYEKGSVIRGLAAAEGDGESVKIFHAGTKAGPGGEILANGGRVLAVTALGADIAAAQKRAYEAVDRIDWPEGFCRRDIGWRAL